MGEHYPSDTEVLGGDEPTRAPTKNDRSLLAAERDTQQTRRLETDANNNLYVNVAEGSIDVTVGEVEIKNDVGNPVPVTGTVSVTEPVSVDDNGGSLTVDGSVTVTNFPASQAVTGPLTDAELRASPVPVSGTVSVTEPVSVDDNGGSLTVDGTVAVSNFPASVEISNDVGSPIPVSGTVSVTEPISVDDNGGSLTVDGTVAVSNFPATQPVSGTVTANQGTPNSAANKWPVEIVDAAGANVAAVSATGAVKVDGSAVTQPISAASLPLPTGAATEATLATLLSAKSSSSSVTSVAASASNVTLLSSNSSRKMATFYNDSAFRLFLKFGATASSSSFTVRIDSQGYFECPLPCYTGQIDGIWGGATGNARITELS